MQPSPTSPRKIDLPAGSGRAGSDLSQRFSKTGRGWGTLRYQLLSLAWRLSRAVWTHGKRLFDLCSAFVLFLVCLPLWLALFVLKLPLGIRLTKTPRVGRWSRVYQELSWTSSRPGVERLLTRSGVKRLPVIWNIVRGEMSLIGPRAVAPGDYSAARRDARARYDVRPGLICLWWIRQRTSIDYGTELGTDREYVESRSFFGDLGIIARAVIALFYGAPDAETPDTINILGIRINNLTMEQALDAIEEYMRGGEPAQISFVNPHCANVAQKDRRYFEALGACKLNLLDGIGMRVAGKMLGGEVRQNVNGTDLFPRLCGRLAGTKQGIFLLGAEPGIVDRVEAWVHEHHSGVEVSGKHHGFFTAEQEPAILELIRQSGAKILLVAFGVPKQDIWIGEHLKETGVAVAMGVGGLFDFYSGKTARAPQWVREIGFEWFFRFYQEPGRLWKRYFLGNIIFLSRVFGQMIRS